MRYGAPQWNIILSTPHGGYRDPTPAEMRWQVYTSLAYGMKGLMYFTYWTSQSGMKEGCVAIVDAEGNPTAHYGPIRQLNAEVRTLGKLLLRLKSTGVFHTGEIPQGCRRLGGDAILHAPPKEPLVIGFFRDGETDYAMIVNRDYRSSRKLTLRADPHVTAVSAVSASDGSTKDIELTKGTFALTLKPGDGRLLRLKTAFNYPMPPEPTEEINFQFEDENDL